MLFIGNLDKDDHLPRFFKVRINKSLASWLYLETSIWPQSGHITVVRLSSEVINDYLEFWVWFLDAIIYNTIILRQSPETSYQMLIKFLIERQICLSTWQGDNLEIHNIIVYVVCETRLHNEDCFPDCEPILCYYCSKHSYAIITQNN